jgi:hypothetical protein
VNRSTDIGQFDRFARRFASTNSAKSSLTLGLRSIKSRQNMSGKRNIAVSKNYIGRLQERLNNGCGPNT